MELIKDGAPIKERITFQPHPKTLTMAGDYEYFAAQGRHPFVYALAEFIDNSLRATRRNAPRPRRINIEFVVSGSNPANAKALICITDNGCGMTKHELNDWAVMNYSMEERGNLPQEPEVANRGAGPGAGRFLSGDLSYFGVGSKNAAFFVGSCVKVSTRKAGEQHVHELCLAAEDLEQRYRNQESVYEEDMIHRNPGDASTLAAFEQPFSVAKTWVESEASETDGCFTRVVVGNLKPDVLSQLMDAENGQTICQELAHLYHYYLHGEAGNRDPTTGPARQGILPSGEPLPDIVLQYTRDNISRWKTSLVQVDDDMETRLLRNQKSELQFTLDVAGKGTVCGVLYYFPYENDRETVPLEHPGSSSFTVMPSPMYNATQMPQMTQHNGATQHPLRNADNASHQSDDEDALPSSIWRLPIFEAFWQGRLIPGARIESLPFIEALRSKRSAQSKDSVPDEVFSRLRGALFFGPGFKVTRNKLLFRDNLQELLASAVPGDRNLEKRFKDWIARCHSTLDKSIRFEAVADSKTQASIRSKLGEGITAFERISDGQRSVSKGDIVRFNVKPLIVGKVAFFTIPRAVREEGAYANGRVYVEALPVAVHGPDCLKDFSLRRLEGVLDDKEASEHAKREMLRVPASLRIEPMKYATGEPIVFAAGDSIPETSVTVMNGGGQRLTRAFYGGKKQGVTVVQRLWQVSQEGAELPPYDPSGATPNSTEKAAPVEEAPAEEEPPAKRQRKGRKGKSKKDENDTANGSDDMVIETATAPELIISVENKIPYKDTFIFNRIADGLKKSGHYALEYLVCPSVPAQDPIRMVVPIFVKAGEPTSIDVSGEGRALVAIKDIILGEALPHMIITAKDDGGNRVPLDSDANGEVKITVCRQSAEGEWHKYKEMTAKGSVEHEDGLIKLVGISVLGKGSHGAQALKTDDAGNGSSAPAQRTISQQCLPAAELFLGFRVGGVQMSTIEGFPIKMRAGAPSTISLAPTSNWADDIDSDVLVVQNGDEIPAFSLTAHDAWGNKTAPVADLKYSAVIECAGFNPPRKEVEFGSNGIAIVEGLRAAVSTKNQDGTEGDWDIVKVSIKYCDDEDECTEGIKQAIECAQGANDKPLELKIKITPSSMPVAARIMSTVTGILPTKQVEQEDGMQTVAIVSGVEAGGSIGGLRMVLVDETGQPSTMQVNGRVTVSWFRGTKKTTWNSDPVKLPPLTAPELVTDITHGFLRFQGTASNPIILECGVEVQSVPAPASKWAVSVLENVNSQCPEDMGAVQCGQSFGLEIEALDRFNNRCNGGLEGQLPVPQITLESEGPLEYNPEEWECGWIQQGQHEVYSAKLILSGSPGPVKVTIKDKGGDGDSLLEEDSLTLELRPGPPAGLVFEGPSTVCCSTRASLSVAVRCCDIAGNRIDPSALNAKDRLDVLLANSALAVDDSGRAAKISVKGASSKARTVDGVARFAEVIATAEAPGKYTLRATSGSRKFALTDAVLTLIMQPQNVVTELNITVPPALQESCNVGTSGRLLVSPTTEDGKPLADEAAVNGLLLRLTPPSGNKADVALINITTSSESEPLVVDGCYVFDITDINEAGTYSAVVEYTETRAELLAGMLKKDTSVRSSTAQFSASAGVAANVTVEAPSLPEHLTATNGSSAKQRTLLRNAAVQLRDAYNNAAQGTSHRVRFMLTLAHEGQSGELPVLEASEASSDGGGVLETDTNGRAFFGTLTLKQGSGTAPSGSLECVLLCQAQGLSTNNEVDAEGWSTCWQCPLLFSDDGARFAAIEKLSERRRELADSRAELASRLDEARAQVSAAVKEQVRANRQVASKLKPLGSAAPQSLAEAEQQVQQLKEAMEGGSKPAGKSWHARYGPAGHNTTAAIDAVLGLGDDGVIGVVAQLATVEDERLAQVASASTRGALAVVIVKDMPTRDKLAKMLKGKKHMIPDMMALTHSIPYRGSLKGDIPGFTNAGPLAKSLVQAASAGTDRPLPLALPHVRASEAAGAKLPADSLGPQDWPKGCLGYLCNLVRPTQKGHRAEVLFTLFASTLVFETLNDAAAYREYVSQVLRQGMPECITLDMGRITGKGIVSGSTFNPPPITKTDFAIGSIPQGEKRGSNGGSAADLTLLENAIEVLRLKEAADTAVTEAKNEVESIEQQCLSEMERLEAEIAEVDGQLADGNRAGNGHVASGRKRGRREAPVEEEEEQQQEEEPEQRPKASKRKRLTKAAQA